MNKEQTIIKAAVHEAGHLALASYLHLGIDGIVIYQNGDPFDDLDLTGKAMWQDHGYPVPNKHESMINAAGFVAECVYLHRIDPTHDLMSKWPTCQDDFAQLQGWPPEELDKLMSEVAKILLDAVAPMIGRVSLIDPSH